MFRNANFIYSPNPLVLNYLLFTHTIWNTNWALQPVGSSIQAHKPLKDFQGAQRIIEPTPRGNWKEKLGRCVYVRPIPCRREWKQTQRYSTPPKNLPEILDRKNYCTFFVQSSLNPSLAKFRSKN